MKICNSLKKLPQEFALLRNYANRHGVSQTFIKILETLTLGRKSKIELEYMNKAQINVIEKEIQSLKKYLVDLPFDKSVFKQALFSTPNDVVAIQLENISNTIKDLNLNLAKLRVSKKVKKDFRDDEVLVANSSIKISNYPTINLKSKFFFISKLSQAKLLFLICCNDEVQSVMLTNSRFCKYFYEKYGLLINEYRGPNFISKDF